MATTEEPVAIVILCSAGNGCTATIRGHVGDVPSLEEKAIALGWIGDGEYANCPKCAKKGGDHGND